ncbi:MAG: hypothetical protein RIC55_34975 [Pirellulaceae bacterium]
MFLATCAAYADDKSETKPDDKAAEKETKQDEGIVVSDGRIRLKPAEGWVRVKPRTRIVEHEFHASVAEGDDDDARITVMGAGGSIEQNIDRWIGQFTQPDGKSTRINTDISQQQVAGQQVHVVKLAGTFRDQLGPFAPATYRKDYRMLGAIIVTEKMGRYYVKMVGPKETVDAHEKAFQGVIDSLTIKADAE